MPFLSSHRHRERYAPSSTLPQQLADIRAVIEALRQLPIATPLKRDMLDAALWRPTAFAAFSGSRSRTERSGRSTRSRPASGKLRTEADGSYRVPALPCPPSRLGQHMLFGPDYKNNVCRNSHRWVINTLVLAQPSLAGFEVATHGRFSGGHRGLFGGDKGNGTSGSPARPKVPRRGAGADRPVVAMKRGNSRGVKGTGQSRHDHLGQLATGGTEWWWRRAAALNGWHEPCKFKDRRISNSESPKFTPN
jgi:hypothetical protein